MKDRLCPICGAESMRRCEMEIETGVCAWEVEMEGDEDDPEQDDDDLLAECGMLPNGLCTLAGTEHCDWDCPRNK
jgi:hypothetical protein